MQSNPLSSRRRGRKNRTRSYSAPRRKSPRVGACHVKKKGAAHVVH